MHDHGEARKIRTHALGQAGRILICHVLNGPLKVAAFVRALGRVAVFDQVCQHGGVIGEGPKANGAVLVVAYRAEGSSGAGIGQMERELVVSKRASLHLLDGDDSCSRSALAIG